MAQQDSRNGLSRRDRSWNVGADNRGVMGYRTPDTDRIACEVR
jgi:hypothetical protein